MKKWAEVKKTITVIPEIEGKEMELLAELVSQLIHRRKQLGWTQEELAHRAGTNQPSIARLENSGRIPKMDSMIKLALAMGMTMKFEIEEGHIDNSV